MSESLTDLSTSAPRFDVVPYCVERDYTLYAFFVCLGVMAAAGLGLGYGASWLYDLVPAIEWVWLVALALALAGLGWILVGQTRLRHEKLSGVIALISGGLAMGGMYYASYLRSSAQINEDVRRWLPYQAQATLRRGGQMEQRVREALNHQLPEEVLVRLTRAVNELPRAEQERLAMLARGFKIEIDPVKKPKKAEPVDVRGVPPLTPEQVGPSMTAVTGQALAEFSFLDFFAWKANQGVRMWLPRIKTINLGYTGSYIFWGVAGLLMLLVPWGTMYVRAEKPLCLQCHRWKTQRPLGRLVIPEAEAVRIFSEGSIVQLASAALTGDGQPGGTVRVKTAQCDDCKETSDLEVILERISQNKDGGDEFSEIVKLTYPGVAIKVLDSLFAAAPPVMDEKPADTVTPDA